MATDLTRTNPVLEGLNNLSIIRQLGLMIGLAASVAIGAGVVLWSKEPSYRPLYTDLSNLDASQIVGVLEQEDILFQIDTNTGVLMVQSDKIHQARLKLASAGYTGTSNAGYELLDKESGFGTSQFMEKAKYRRSIEGELSKTITSIKNVRAARVHLAIPKKTVFLNDKRHPSASVLIDLHPGRKLAKPQIIAVTHLVASSIPELTAEYVTVVDQYGNMLSDTEGSAEMIVAAKQLEYSAKIEQQYQERIAEIIEPLVGADKYRVQVSAEVDFTLVEQTAETFNPDLPAVRSEQTLDENTGANGAALGIPGALSNQPPTEATVPETAGADENENNNTVSAANGNSRSQATRNFELDRTISHTRYQAGTIKRITVAVVLDDKSTTVGEGKESELVRTPFSADEMERISILIKDTIGFSGARGDRVNVLNQAFVARQIDDASALPEESIFEQAWIWELGKQSLGAIFLLILVMAVLRPILKSLASAGESAGLPDLPEQMELAPEPELEEEVTISGGPETLLPGPEQSYEAQLNAVKGMIADDPRRVAQVVKTWLAQGAE
ncbi:MAG: flagellar M-ring protein FliF [Pseudomonadales bacterium]|nr:flagellar M-ring protein FliF [Pseudomonadales bacterium]